MGIFKQAKIDTIAAKATKAHEDGRVVFVARLSLPVFQSGMSVEIEDWGYMIESVERAGWILAEFSVVQDTKDRPEAYAVFRRRR